LDSILGLDVAELEVDAVRPFCEVCLMSERRCWCLEEVEVSFRDELVEMYFSCVLRVRCSASRGFTVVATGPNRAVPVRMGCALSWHLVLM
jgi:hypothetical protein